MKNKKKNHLSGEEIATLIQKMTIIMKRQI